MENWLPIKEFPRYEISDYGRVRSLFTDRIMKISYSGGYGHVKFSIDGLVYTRNVHRLVAQAFIQNDLEGHVVRHYNSDLTDNCVWNLYIE